MSAGRDRARTLERIARGLVDAETTLAAAEDAIADGDGPEARAKLGELREQLANLEDLATEREREPAAG